MFSGVFWVVLLVFWVDVRRPAWCCVASRPALQAGRRVLPKSALPDEGWVQPPLAMDGIPAPDSAVTPPHVRSARRSACFAPQGPEAQNLKLSHFVLLEAARSV